MKPNIFDIATKELHQDAFITWLLLFADNRFKAIDSKLNECAKTLIKKLIEAKYLNFQEEIFSVRARRQVQHIDVWAEVNDRYLIIIEDKTVSSEHTDQLHTYKTFADDWCKNSKYEEAICIYLKTGNESQSSLNKIRQKGFEVFSRIDFLNVLNQFNDITNNIFIDFKERLARIEKANTQFENKLIAEWSSDDWQGFFQYIERTIKIVNWNYVNNRAGGFWCLVLNWDELKAHSTVLYLQIENKKLCFKITTHPGDVKIPDEQTRTSVRQNVHALLMSKAKESNLPEIQRPKRFGNGNYMTIGVVDQSSWLGEDNSIVDKTLIIESLNKYLGFLQNDVIGHNESIAI